MRPESQAVENGPHAMLIDARVFIGRPRQVVVRIVLRIDRPTFEKMRCFVENRQVAGGQDVAACRPRGPQVIVRAMRAHAAAPGRMAAILNGPSYEVTGPGRPEM